MITLPKHKTDLDSVTALQTVPVSDLAPHLAELLEWLQDYNWPVSRPLIPVFVRCGDLLIPHIKQVFSGNDYVWQYWVISVLLPELPPSTREIFRDELVRLIEQPTKDESEHELPEVARETLELHDEKMP